MGFPDNFEFKGRRTTMSWERHLSQYNQIGNSVCPPVAAALGNQIIHAINSAKLNINSGKIYNSLVPLSRKKELAKSTPLPMVASIVGTEIESNLTKLGENFLGIAGVTFSRQGFSVPTAALPAALIFAASKLCPVCSVEHPPFCVHSGEMPFLISKENLQSLRDNGQDHGLDYHLRYVFGISHQVGHLVGEQLADLNLVELLSIVNKRTGRRVRGMRLKESVVIPAELSEIFLRKLLVN